MLVYLDLRICDAPLQESESAPAGSAPERINVKEAYQTFRTEPTDSFNVSLDTLDKPVAALNLPTAGFSRVGYVSVVYGRAKKRTMNKTTYSVSRPNWSDSSPVTHDPKVRDEIERLAKEYGKLKEPCRFLSNQATLLFLLLLREVLGWLIYLKLECDTSIYVAAALRNKEFQRSPAYRTREH